MKKIIIIIFLLISLIACAKEHPAENKTALICVGEISGLSGSSMTSTYNLVDKELVGYEVVQRIPFELTEAYVEGASVAEVIANTMELYKNWQADQLEYLVTAEDDNFIHNLKIVDIKKASQLELQAIGLGLDADDNFDPEIIKNSAEANGLVCEYK